MFRQRLCYSLWTLGYRSLRGGVTALWSKRLDLLHHPEMRIELICCASAGERLFRESKLPIYTHLGGNQILVCVKLNLHPTRKSLDCAQTAQRSLV